MVIGVFEIWSSLGSFSSFSLWLRSALSCTGVTSSYRDSRPPRDFGRRGTSPAAVGDDPQVAAAEGGRRCSRAEAEAYAAEVRAKADRQLEAAEAARHDVDEEARQRRSELRDQRLEVERREQRLADREERLDSDNRALEEKARHLDVIKAELKAQRRALQDAEADLQHALERIAGLTAEQAKAELVAAVEHDAKRQAVILARDIEREATSRLSRAPR